jgi:hypothetical protein
MPYQYDWFIDGQVLYTTLWGKQTLEELVVSNAEISALLDAAEGGLIHMLIDDSQLGELPASLFQIRKTLTYATHKNLGWAIVFGVKERTLTSAVTDYLIATLAKLTRARYIRVKTFSEAIDHLKSVDASVQWDNVNPELQAKLGVQ